MFSFRRLVEDARDYFELVDVGVNEDFEFEQQDKVFLILEGSILAYGEKDPETGIKATQTFTKDDPIGFAEAIAGRSMQLQFRKLTDLSLRGFCAAELKKQVNESKVFSQTIIKYSLSRIFDQKRSAKYFSFEDEFIGKNYDFLKRIRVAREEDVFRLNEAATKMFFIEKGSIGIFSRNNKQIAELGVGECFGESAMLNDRTRRYTAVANKDSSLLLIEDDKVEKELAKDTPLVRLSVVVLLKRLELMNRLRMVKKRG